MDTLSTTRKVLPNERGWNPRPVLMREGLVSLGIADGVLSAQARLIGRKWSSGSQRVFGSKKRCCGYSFASWQRVVLLSLWFLHRL